MKAPPSGILITLLLAVSYLFSRPMAAQTIQIDSIFTTDGEIFPFEQNDTIYGLSITGSVNLNSDTSLVRVILTDDAGNEWMVYEAYPMIVTDTAFSINEVCDETCFLELTIPYSLRVQLFDASLNLGSCNISSNAMNDPALLQYQYKIEREIFKVAMINNYISDNNWTWQADTNFLSNIYHYKKSSFFGYKYNLLGYDYYTDGIYKNIRATEVFTDNSSNVDAFDWRNKHDANVPGTHYFDSNPDYPQILNG